MYNKYKMQKLRFLDNFSSKTLLYVKRIYYICTTKNTSKLYETEVFIHLGTDLQHLYSSHSQSHSQRRSKGAGQNYPAKVNNQRKETQSHRQSA